MGITANIHKNTVWIGATSKPANKLFNVNEDTMLRLVLRRQQQWDRGRSKPNWEGWAGWGNGQQQDTTRIAPDQC